MRAQIRHHSDSDGKFYLLYARKAVEGHEAVAVITYPSPQNPHPFDSAAAAIAFAKDHLARLTATSPLIPATRDASYFLNSTGEAHCRR